MSDTFRFIAKLVSVLLACVAVLVVAVYGVRHVRVHYRVAVPEIADGTRKSLQDIGRVIAEENTWLSIRRVPVEGFAGAAAALESRAADFAVLRPDIALPPSARTVAVLRRVPIFLITPAKSAVESFKDLRGRKVGIIESAGSESELLDKILDYYSVPAASVARMPITSAQIAAAFRQKTIAAVLVLATPEAAVAADAFAAVAKATKKTPEIVGIDEAEAVTRRVPGLESAEIAVGAFGGASPRPEEAVTTVAATYRFMAREDLSNVVVGEAARLLFSARSRLAQGNLAVSAIEIPDTDDKSLDLHPGAKAYFSGEQPGVFDKFESLFWIGSALISVLASAMAWVISKLRGGETNLNKAGLAKLVAFIGRVHEADSSGLSALEDELDAFVLKSVRARADGEMETEDFNSVSLAVGYARTAIETQRRRLEQQVETQT